MTHTRERFLIPELNMVANDSELKNLQKQMLMQQYQRDIHEKNKRNHPRPQPVSYLNNPENPMYQSKVQLDIERNIRQDLAQAYQNDIERKGQEKRHVKQDEMRRDDMILQRAKQISELDRKRAMYLQETFRREAMEQLQDSQRRKQEEKRREQEEKLAYQRRYSTSLLSLQKERSFKEHYQNVNGMQELNERNYMSLVMPQNNLREREKERIVEEGIRRSDAQLRQQLQYESGAARRYRNDLRDSLTEQIREKEAKKKRELMAERSEGYTSLDYRGRHHPINNPVDFKITHDNRYIIGELQSGLARSGSHSMLH